MVGHILDPLSADGCRLPDDSGIASQKCAPGLGRSRSAGCAHELDIGSETSTVEGSECSAALRTPSMGCTPGHPAEDPRFFANGELEVQQHLMTARSELALRKDSASSGQLSSRSLPRAFSLPARLCDFEDELQRRSAARPTLQRPPSWARFGIPRSATGYFELYRFARTHSEGLLFARSTPEGVFADCRQPPRALSEGLLGGRIFHTGPRPEGEEAPAKVPPKPLAELVEGEALDGKVIRTASAGLVLDVGATRPGFLPRRCLRNVPRRLLQKGSVLSGLEVQSVDLKKRRLTLRFRSAADDRRVEEDSYAALMSHVSDWADVSVWRPPPTLPAAEEGEAEGVDQLPRFSSPALQSPPWPCCMSTSGRAWSCF